MWSKSASESNTRPFYAAFAQVYDQLVDAPTQPWTDAICAELTQRLGLSAGANILDAGCGTGRHAADLIRRGHEVDLADASRSLLDQAATRCPGSRTHRVDLCHLVLPQQFDAVTSRGVLNDMVEDDERDAVLRGFSSVLRPGGIVFLDVREATASAARADNIERSRTVTLTTGAELTFTSKVSWRDETLHVQERYELLGHQPQTYKHEFTMRPWTHRELETRLASAGFVHAHIDAGVGRTTGDRLFVVAHRE